MANYVYIEDGNIVEYHDLLPQSWRHISGLHLLSPEERIRYGWYSVVNISDYHDTETSYIAGYTYDIFDDHVVQTPQIINFSDEELALRQEQKKINFFMQLRMDRNDKLKNCDWTQLSDIQKVKSPEWITAWENYRQALRDLPQVYENTTDFNFYNISWPPEPVE